MYNTEEKQILLELANAAIMFGLENQAMIKIEQNNYPVNLKQIRSCFVTLTLNNNLRGCIGSLNAHQALVSDVRHNAYAAAFEDPRFPTLTKSEFNNISIDISILSQAEKITFNDEDNLLSQLKIGIDGLILEYQHYRATYLPSVWSSLSSPQSFVNSLKEKAGLKSNFWSSDINFYRYTTELVN